MKCPYVEKNELNYEFRRNLNADICRPRSGTRLSLMNYAL